MIPPSREAVEWKHVHERLEEARRRLDEGVQSSSDDVRTILESRAATLAEPLPEAAAPVETVELLVFSRGEESYAVDAASVLAVFPFVDSTEVPFTPAAVLGVVNHRGRILPVLDLSDVLQPARAEAKPTLVIAAEAGDAAFGIAADPVCAVVTVAVHEIMPAPEGGEQPDALVRGVTRMMATVLDLAALIHDPRVEVNDDVE